MHEVRIPGHPAVAGVAAAIANLLAVLAIVAIPFQPDFLRFFHLAGNLNLSTAGEAAFRWALEKHQEHLQTDLKNDSTSMQDYIIAYTPDSRPNYYVLKLRT
jgi:hypothetical protein